MATPRGHWLDSLAFSSGTKTFIQDHKEDIIQEAFFEEDEMKLSVAMFQVATRHASLEVLQDLLQMFVRGEICATHFHYAPLYSGHESVSGKNLSSLIEVGVLTTGGQERAWNATWNQRGYLSGHFIIAPGTSTQDVLAMMTSIGACFGITVDDSKSDEPGAIRASSASFIHTTGDDCGVDRTFDSPEDMNSVLQSIFVTTEDDVGFTNVNVDTDIEIFGLERLQQGDVVNFMIWDATWPLHDEEPRQSLETMLLDAIDASPEVTLVTGLMHK